MLRYPRFTSLAEVRLMPAFDEPEPVIVPPEALFDPPPSPVMAKLLVAPDAFATLVRVMPLVADEVLTLVSTMLRLAREAVLVPAIEIAWMLLQAIVPVVEVSVPVNVLTPIAETPLSGAMSRS